MFNIILNDNSCFEFKNREIIDNNFCITLINTNIEDIKGKFTKDNLSKISFTSDDAILQDYELVKIIDNVKENTITVVLHELDKKDEIINQLKDQNEQLSDQFIDMQVKAYEEQDI